MNHSGPVTLSQVKSALQELGGEATWDEILDQVTKNRNGDYSYYLDWLNYNTTAFQVVQQHCLGYKKYLGPTHFEKVGGKRYRLIGDVSAGESIRRTSVSLKPQLTPIATDTGEPSQPERVKQEEYRILRDAAKSKVPTQDQFKPVGKAPSDYVNSRQKRRTGQAAFRQSLLDAYHARCCISREHCLTVLEAAHIEPHVDERSDHVQNGLLLRADLHNLFDAGLITISQSYRVRTSPQLISPYYLQYQGTKIRLPEDRSFWPSERALAIHRGQIFKGG